MRVTHIIDHYDITAKMYKTLWFCREYNHIYISIHTFQYFSQIGEVISACHRLSIQHMKVEYLSIQVWWYTFSLVHDIQQLYGCCTCAHYDFSWAFFVIIFIWIWGGGGTNLFYYFMFSSKRVRIESELEVGRTPIQRHVLTIMPCYVITLTCVFWHSYQWLIVHSPIQSGVSKLSRRIRV